MKTFIVTLSGGEEPEGWNFDVHQLTSKLSVEAPSLIEAAQKTLSLLAENDSDAVMIAIEENR